MVSSTRSDSTLKIVARPDQSSTWRTNMLVLFALSIPSLGAAIAFAFAGAWPILPLAGLELTALGTALYLVNRKLQIRQVITVSGEAVTVDKGYERPREHWHFARGATGLAIVPEQHPWEGPAITLHDRSDSVELGEFLSRQDTLRLIELLRGEIRVGSNARHTRVDF